MTAWDPGLEALKQARFAQEDASIAAASARDRGKDLERRLSLIEGQVADLITAMRALAERLDHPA